MTKKRSTVTLDAECRMLLAKVARRWKLSPEKALQRAIAEAEDLEAPAGEISLERVPSERSGTSPK